MTTQTPAVLVLATAARTATERPQRRPDYVIPAVMCEQVGLAASLLCGKYPTLGKAEALYDWALASRNSAHALVQKGWAMAQIEKDHGNRRWFFETWVPAMKAAQADGTPLPEETTTGQRLRLSHDGRQHVIDSLRPVFVPDGVELDREAAKRLNRAIVGVGGRHLELSRHLLGLIHGEDTTKNWWKQVEEADKAARANAEADAEAEAPAEEDAAQSA